MADIDWSKLSDDQIKIADKIAAEAVKQKVDPNLALTIGYLESSFNPNPSQPKDPKTGKPASSATGPMQLTKDTAKQLDVDPTNIDENIKGGVSYIKQGLEKYNDPYMAALHYKEGPTVAAKYAETNDMSVIPDTGIQYWDRLSQHLGPIPASAKEPAQSDKDEREKIFGKVRPPTALAPVEPTAAPTIATPVINFAKDIGSAIWNSPEGMAAIVAGPSTAYAQHRLNKAEAKAAEAAAKAKSAGEKWAEAIGGPGGETVTGAAKNLQLEKKLGEGETLTKSGVALPPGAKERLEAELKAEGEKLVPRVKNVAQKVGAWGKKFPLGNLALGLGTAANIEALKERHARGDIPGELVSGLGTTFNALSMLPVSANPYLLGAKGAGMIGTAGMIPIEMAYEAYRSKHPLEPKKAEVTVGKPEIQTKADGGPVNFAVPLSLRHVHFHRLKKSRG